MDKIYYPLTTSINYSPVLCLEGILSDEDLLKIQDQIKTIDVGAALVGYDPVDQLEYEKRRIDAHSIRKSNVGFLDRSSWEWLYEKMCSAVNQANTINYSKFLYGIEPLQYSEYDSSYSGFYGPHVDQHACNISDVIKRSLSFSVQLSREDEYTGGELKIYYDNKIYVANKKLGCITFFDSAILHEVTPVTSGFRKSLVGWVVGPRV